MNKLSIKSISEGSWCFTTKSGWIKFRKRVVFYRIDKTQNKTFSERNGYSKIRYFGRFGFGWEPVKSIYDRQFIVR